MLCSPLLKRVHSFARLHEMRYSSGTVSTAELRQSLQETMQRHAAVFRTGSLMAEGVQKLDEVNNRFKDIKLTDRSLIW